MPSASLVHGITVLSFKLQVVVTKYLNHNYPQHFHYKTLVLNSVKLPIWVKKYASL